MSIVLDTIESLHPYQEFQVSNTEINTGIQVTVKCTLHDCNTGPVWKYYLTSF